MKRLKKSLTSKLLSGARIALTPNGHKDEEVCFALSTNSVYLDSWREVRTYMWCADHLPTFTYFVFPLYYGCKKRLKNGRGEYKSF